LKTILCAPALCAQLCPLRFDRAASKIACPEAELKPGAGLETCPTFIEKLFY